MGWHMMVIYPSKTGCWMGLGHHRSGDDQHRPRLIIQTLRWIPCLSGNMLCICARTSTCCRSKISRSSLKRSSSQCNNSGPSMARNLMENWWKPMCNPATQKKTTNSFSYVRFWMILGWFWELNSLDFLVLFCCRTRAWYGLIQCLFWAFAIGFYAILRIRNYCKNPSVFQPGP